MRATAYTARELCIHEASRDERPGQVRELPRGVAAARHGGGCGGPGGAEEVLAASQFEAGERPTEIRDGLRARRRLSRKLMPVLLVLGREVPIHLR